VGGEAARFLRRHLLSRGGRADPSRAASAAAARARASLTCAASAFISGGATRA
jgi:hypothetical protein